MATLSLLSTVIGGGIVGLPFAFYQLGIPLGIFSCILIATLNYLSAKVYFKTRELIPGKPESFYEMGYMLSGRISIYIVSFIIFFLCFGLSIIYFVLFGKLCQRSMLLLGVTSKLFTIKATYKVLLGLALIPVVLKKELKEIKFASIVLFTGIIIFMFVIANNMIFYQWIPAEEGAPVSLFNRHLWLPEGKTGIIEGLANILLAFGYQQSLFPMYQSLKDKSDENVLTVVKNSMTMVTGLYIVMGIVGSLMFGYKVQVDIFQNINDNGHVLLDLFLEITFAIILAIHIIYIFYAAKETLLVMWDETSRRSISKDLEVRQSLRSLGSNFMASQNSELAYKDMNQLEYILLSVGSFLLIIIASIFMEDIGLVFTILSAISTTSLSFLFPGFFFLIALKKYQNNGYWRQQAYEMTKKLSYIFIVVGFIMFTIQVLDAFVFLRKQHFKLPLELVNLNWPLN